MVDKFRDSGFSRGGVSVGGDICKSNIIIANGAVNIRNPITGNKTEIANALKLKALMDSPSWICVLDFMDRTFATRILKELNNGEIGRVKAYASAIIRKQQEGENQ